MDFLEEISKYVPADLLGIMTIYSVGLQMLKTYLPSDVVDTTKPLPKPIAVGFLVANFVVGLVAAQVHPGNAAQGWWQHVALQGLLLGLYAHLFHAVAQKMLYNPAAGGAR